MRKPAHLPDLEPIVRLEAEIDLRMHRVIMDLERQILLDEDSRPVVIAFLRCAYGQGYQDSKRERGKLLELVNSIYTETDGSTSQASG